MVHLVHLVHFNEGFKGEDIENLGIQLYSPDDDKEIKAKYQRYG